MKSKSWETYGQQQTSLNNETIQIGDYAEVISIEGSHVVVKKINKGDDTSC